MKCEVKDFLCEMYKKYYFRDCKKSVDGLKILLLLYFEF